MTEKMATVGCEGCNREITIPLDQETCPHCGAPLWEDDEPEEPKT